MNCSLFVRLSLPCLSLLCGVALSVRAEDAKPPVGEAEAYPLGSLMKVLEQDLTSPEYRVILDGMIPTDLAAEWKRVTVPDNAEVFAHANGDRDKVQADPKLKAAFERRQKIGEGFLALMRVEFQKRKLKVPFDGVTIDYLNTSSNAGAFDPSKSLPVRVVLPTPDSGNQWSRWRGSSGQGAASSQENFPLEWNSTQNVVWKTELPGPGNGSPTIWGDRLFVVADVGEEHERQLLCYSRANGKLVWKQAAPKTEQKEKLYWKNTYASSTPVTDGERVIVFFGNSGMSCFDMEGHPLWQRDLGEFTTMHGPGASPVLHRDKVIFIQDQNKGSSVCVALSKLTGEVVWRQERPNDNCWTTPVVLRVGDRDELVHNGSHAVTAYNPETGEKLWWVEGTSIESIPTIVTGGGLIYSVSGRNGPTLAIRPGGSGHATATHRQWINQTGGPHVPSPAYHDGRLFLINDTGVATCLDAMTGKTVWQRRLRGKFTASIIECGGKLLLLNETGTCTVLEAGPEFKVLAENELDADTLTTPALLDGRLYFRTKTDLICIGSNDRP
ncbi:MAG: PQQ-binding-like beta-propeller repeat protein [Planctomycetota bacterium]